MLYIIFYILCINILHIVYVYIYIYWYRYINLCLGKIIDSKNRLEVACYAVPMPSWQSSELLITTVGVTFKTGWLVILSFVSYIPNIILLNLTENFLFCSIFNHHMSLCFEAVFDNKVSSISTLIVTIAEEDLTFWLLNTTGFQETPIFINCYAFWQRYQNWRYFRSPHF